MKQIQLLITKASIRFSIYWNHCQQLWVFCQFLKFRTHYLIHALVLNPVVYYFWFQNDTSHDSVSIILTIVNHTLGMIPVIWLSFSFLLFHFQYTPAIDIWSIGCIFAELLTGKPLFPGKNVVHQLDLMTDLLGTPSAEAIARVCFLW